MPGKAVVSIFDGYRQTVCNSLIHGVAVNFLTESLIRFSNRRTAEANESRLRECLLQNLRIGLRYHGPHIFISILAELDLLCVLQLGSMGFVGETNDIGPLVDQTDLIIFSVTELLNGTNIETTAFPGTQFLPQSTASGIGCPGERRILYLHHSKIL